MRKNKETVSRPDEIINRGYSGGLLFMILGVFIVFTSLSGVWLYLDMYRPLDTHYSAVVSILSDIHETLVVKTIKMNFLFFILIFAGILLLGILYTHRIVGPLQRIKMSAKAVTEGRLDARIKFRKRDAIHAFGDAFNEMTDRYADQIDGLTGEAGRMEESLTALRTMAEEGKSSEAELNKVLEADVKIRELLSRTKI